LYASEQLRPVFFSRVMVKVIFVQRVSRKRYKYPEKCSLFFSLPLINCGINMTQTKGRNPTLNVRKVLKRY
jgi:hypothetical protein